MGVRKWIHHINCPLEGTDHSCREDRSQRSSVEGVGLGAQDRPFRFCSQGLKQFPLSFLTHLSISGPAQMVSWSDLDGPFLGRKAMTNLGCVLKSRDITLPTKVRMVKAVVFPVVMYGCESWTIRKGAAAAAKSLQSRLTLCDPIDGLLQGSVPGILQVRTLEWVAISFPKA